MSDETRIPPAESEGAGSARKSVTPQERLLLLDMWQRSGLTARDFSGTGGRLAPATLFEWKKRFDRLGPGGPDRSSRAARRAAAGCRSPRNARF